MKTVAMLFAMLLSSASFAATNIILIQSNEVDVPAWRRDVVGVSGGELRDPSGVTADLASASAVSNVSARAAEVSDAALSGVTNAMDELYSKTNLIPAKAMHIALSIAPTAHTNLVGYVVEESTDGTNDTQWVHYNMALGLKPNRTVEYTWPGGSGVASATWESWTATGIATNGWTGVHKCIVVRPLGARGARCLTKRNEIFGGATGFDFGSATVTVNGVPTYTGSVTNGVTGEVLTFDNGVIKQ